MSSKEAEYISAEGNERPPGESGSPVVNDAEDELLAVQEELDAAKARIRELEEFAFVAAHDLQEPLQTIETLTSLVHARVWDELDNETQEAIGYISESTERMRDRVCALLDYARLGRRGERETIDCSLLMQQVCVDLFGSLESSGTDLKVGSLPTVEAVRDELRLLFQNLLGNAIKFRSPDRAPAIKVSAREVDEHWQFTISDNGIGIEERHFARIFRVYERLHGQSAYPGTGLGLAHCQRIVALHNGRIWVESTPREGSTFHFTLPVATA